MPHHWSPHSIATEHEFPSIAGFFFAGMLGPFVVAATAHETLSLYVSGGQFLGLSAAVFSLVVWVLLARFDLDRVNVVFASIALPWFFSLALLQLGLVFGTTEAHYLLEDFNDLLAYAGAFMLAGIAAVALQRGAERLSGTYDWLPAPGTLAVVVVAAVVVAPVVVGGAVAHLTAASASVSHVEQVTLYPVEPGLNVTVEGDQTELRLTVTAPDGSSTTQRLSYGDMADGEETVPIDFREFDSARPQAGTYHIEVAAISGLTVETASYEIERTATPTLVAVETAQPGEELNLSHPSAPEEYRFDAHSETRVGVLLENRGDVADRFYVRLVADDEQLNSGSRFLEPGQHGATVVPLSEEDVERIEQAGGTVTVEAVYGEIPLSGENIEHVARTEIALPDAGG